jgi:drug/metabolite transporter (DMT)-like permease
VLLGWLIWGDVPGPLMILGSVIVAASGLYILQRERRRPRS